MLIQNVNEYGPILRLDVLGQVYCVLTDVKDVEVSLIFQSCQIVL